MSPNNQPNDDFTPESAQARLRRHVDNIPPSKGAAIARVPDLDVCGLLAFSVMPSTGLAGEVIYLVGPDEMISSGLRTTINEIMRRLEVGTRPNVLDVHRFAHLFLRLRAHRRGVVLDAPDGHVLLRPDQLPADQFSPPEASLDEEGAHFRFWIYETGLMEPLYFDVLVAPEGTTTFIETGPE
ncbi:MAG: hypothetical protein JXA42_13920 [Anaerolineales bacterium]|nr:hypothetical protein [Anaerolineales bacterium]